MVNFICSDAHKGDHIEKIKEIKISKKHLPEMKIIIENNKNLFSNFSA